MEKTKFYNQEREREMNGAALIDWIKKHKHLKNYAAVAKNLKLTAPQISKVRTGIRPVSDAFLAKVSRLTGDSVGFIETAMQQTPDEV